MFGINGFHVSASGAIQGHDGPLVFLGLLKVINVKELTSSFESHAFIFRGITKDVFLHDDAVYGLSPDPTNPHVFASSCDNGHVLIYDIRDSAGGTLFVPNLYLTTQF